MNVKSPNNTSKWQMGFNSAFKGLSKNENAAPAKVISNNDHKIEEECRIAWE
jgi:hypothetical protein